MVLVENRQRLENVLKQKKDHLLLKGIKSKSSKSKTLTLPSSKSKTKKKGNYRSFLKCEMKKLKKENPNMKQPNIMKMAAKNWNKGKMKGGSKGG